MLLSSVLIFFIFLFKFNSSFFFSSFRKKKSKTFSRRCVSGFLKFVTFFSFFFFFQRLYIIYKNVNQIIVGDDSFFWIESNNFQSICFGYRKILIFFFFSFLFFSNTANDVHYKHNTEFPANLLEYVLIELIFARLKFFFSLHFILIFLTWCLVTQVIDSNQLPLSLTVNFILPIYFFFLFNMRKKHLFKFFGTKLLLLFFKFQDD